MLQYLGWVRDSHECFVSPHTQGWDLFLHLLKSGQKWCCGRAKSSLEQPGGFGFLSAGVPPPCWEAAQAATWWGPWFFSTCWYSHRAPSQQPAPIWQPFEWTTWKMHLPAAAKLPSLMPHVAEVKLSSPNPAQANKGGCFQELSLGNDLLHSKKITKTALYNKKDLTPCPVFYFLIKKIILPQVEMFSKMLHQFSGMILFIICCRISYHVLSLDQVGRF